MKPSMVSRFRTWRHDRKSGREGKSGVQLIIESKALDWIGFIDTVVHGE